MYFPRNIRSNLVGKVKPTSQTIKCKHTLHTSARDSPVTVRGGDGKSANMFDKNLSLARKLQLMDEILTQKRAISSERLINLMKEITEQAAGDVPLTFMISLANTFIRRKDMISLELLLHMARGSWKYSAENARHRLNPWEKLMSHSISELFKCGNPNDASTLLMRMSSSGYRPSIGSLLSILDGLGSTSRVGALTLPLLKSILRTAEKEHWDQQHRFYTLLLRAVRKYVSHHCTSSKDVKNAWLFMQQLQLRIEAQNQANNIERLAAVVSCCAALLTQISAGRTADEEMHAAVLSNMNGVFLDFMAACEVGSLPCRARDVAAAARSLLAPSSEYSSGQAQSHTSTAGKAITESLRATLCGATNSAQKWHGDAAVREAASEYFLAHARAGSLADVIADLRSFVHAIIAPADTAQERDMKQTPRGDFFDSSDFQHRRQQFALGVQDISDRVASRLSGDTSIDLNFSVLQLEEAFISSAASSAPHEATRAPADEREWLASLFRDIMANDAAVSRLHPVQDRRLSFASLSRNLSCLERIMIDAGVKPTHEFYAAAIDAVHGLVRRFGDENMEGAPHWSEGLLVAQMLIDGLADETRRSASIEASITNLLCARQSVLGQQPDPVAVQHAIAALDAAGAETGRLQLHSLCAVIKASTLSLSEAHLQALIAEGEGILNRQSVSAEGEAALLEALIFANARVRNGLKAFQLATRLRNSNVILRKRMYKWIIMAICQSTPRDSREWNLVKYPEVTVKRLIHEMQRSNIALDSDLLALLLRLYTKAAQIASKQGKDAEVLSSMLKFVELHCGLGSNAQTLSTATAATSEIVRELIKAHCVAGKEEEAYRILTDAENTYGVKIGPELYEPIMFSFAAVKGLLNLAKDIVVEMTNRDMPLTDGIVVPLALCHLNHGDPRDALDCLQDMYNQYSVRAPASTWLLLIDHSLARGDVFEARRAVALLDMMYSPGERASLIGPKSSASKNMEKAKGDVTSSLPVAGHSVKLGTPYGQRCAGVLTREQLLLHFGAYGFKLSDKKN